jgi:hypothetical protein
MIEIKSTGQEKDAWKKDREPLFSIDGVEYTIPKAVPTNVGLKAMDHLARVSEPEGVRYIMILMLEKEGWDALQGADGLEEADLRTIQEIIRKKVFGDTDQGN